MNRRSLILGLTGALAAPAIVRAESLMKLWVPPAPKFGLRKWVAKNESLIMSPTDFGPTIDFYTATWVRVGWDAATGEITRTVVALEDAYA